jgi:hypothetical protein
VSEIWKLCKEFSVIGVVEAHGCLISLRTSLARCLRTHTLYCSHAKDTNGNILNSLGGICVLVAKTLFAPPLAPTVVFQDVSEGRAVQLGVHNAEGTKHFDVFFVHNFGFNALTTTALIKRIDDCRKLCVAHPHTNSMALMGDFNLEPKGSLKISLLDASSLSRFLPPQVPPRPFESKWNVLFDKLVEVDFPFPSHVNSYSLVLSRIN